MLSPTPALREFARRFDVAVVCLGLAFWLGFGLSVLAFWGLVSWWCGLVAFGLVPVFVGRVVWLLEDFLRADGDGIH